MRMHCVFNLIVNSQMLINDSISDGIMKNTYT